MLRIKLFLLFWILHIQVYGQECIFSPSNCDYSELKEYNVDSLLMQNSFSSVKIIYYEQTSGFKADVYYYHLDSLGVAHLERLSNKNVLSFNSIYTLKVDDSELENACFISSCPRYKRTDCIDVLMVQFRNGMRIKITSIDNTLEEILKYSDEKLPIKSEDFWGEFFMKKEELRLKSIKN